jgi:hypothetical protein
MSSLSDVGSYEGALLYSSFTSCVFIGTGKPNQKKERKKKNMSRTFALCHNDPTIKRARPPFSLKSKET